MNVQQPHHQHMPPGLFCYVEAHDFIELHPSDQTALDDSVWEEFESGYTEEPFPNHVLSFLKEAAWE